MTAHYEPETEIREAIRNGDEAGLGAVTRRIGTYCFRDASGFEGSVFSDSIFNVILEMLGSPQFLQMRGSWHLLTLLQTDWAILSEHQRTLLLPALEGAYDKFLDWMSCFVIAELLGENYASATALEVLGRLRSVSNEKNRAVVVRGLECIVRHAADRDLAAKALVMLGEMKEDPSQVVRQEALDSCTRLRGRLSEDQQRS